MRQCITIVAYPQSIVCPTASPVAKIDHPRPQCSSLPCPFIGTLPHPLVCNCIWALCVHALPVMISSFSFLYFFTSLTVRALPDSSLLTTHVPWPSTVFFYLLIICSTTFPHILPLVLLTSSMTFFFLLHCYLDYIMDSRPGYINPRSNPCIP